MLVLLQLPDCVCDVCLVHVCVIVCIGFIGLLLVSVLSISDVVLRSI